MFENIVVAIDGSKQAENALEVACDLAKKYGSELHLVHSPQLETAGIAVGSGAVEIKPSSEKVAEAGRVVTDKAIAQATDLGCAPQTCSIGNEAPAKEILKAIDGSSADLVVMGRRGLGGLNSLILGSVSQQVSNQAKCTCVTVS